MDEEQRRLLAAQLAANVLLDNFRPRTTVRSEQRGGDQVRVEVASLLDQLAPSQRAAVLGVVAATTPATAPNGEQIAGNAQPLPAVQQLPMWRADP